MKTAAEIQSEMDELDKQSASMQEQIRSKRMELMRVRAKENRVNVRSQLSPEQMKKANQDDTVMHEAFSSEAGRKALELMRETYPVIVDRISEALDRVNASTGTQDVVASSTLAT